MRVMITAAFHFAKNNHRYLCDFGNYLFRFCFTFVFLSLFQSGFKVVLCSARVLTVKKVRQAAIHRLKTLKNSFVCIIFFSHLWIKDAFSNWMHDATLSLCLGILMDGCKQLCTLTKIVDYMCAIASGKKCKNRVGNAVKWEFSAYRTLRVLFPSWKTEPLRA